MASIRPAFFKPAPCSRATRIRKFLRLPARLQATSRSKSTHQILEAILQLLTDKSGALEARMDVLMGLLGKLPAWTEWTEREDVVLGSALDEFKSCDSKETGEIQETILAEELIRQNGNVAYLQHKDLESPESPGRFLFLFTQWLHHRSSPENPHCHVQDERGHWLNDESLRQRLREGWQLHILTRCLRRLRPKSSRPRAHDMVQPPSQPRSLAVTSLKDEIRDALMHDSIKPESVTSSALSPPKD